MTEQLSVCSDCIHRPAFEENSDVFQPVLSRFAECGFVCEGVEQSVDSPFAYPQPKVTRMCGLDSLLSTALASAGYEDTPEENTGRQMFLRGELDLSPKAPKEVLERLCDVALETRCPVSGGRDSIIGWYKGVEVKTGRTGARVHRFAIGGGEAMQLITLSQQPGHETVVGIIHSVEAIKKKPRERLGSGTYYVDHYCFDRGRSLTVKDVEQVTAALLGK